MFPLCFPDYLGWSDPAQLWPHPNASVTVQMEDIRKFQAFHDM